jgi:hypothetical protein
MENPHLSIYNIKRKIITGLNMAPKIYKLGICTDTYNAETIKRMLEQVSVPVQPVLIKDIDSDTTHMMDTLFLINPEFNESQKTAFLKFLSSGGTALYALSMNHKSVRASKTFLADFGIKVVYGRETSKLPVEYLSSYPQERKHHLQKGIPVDEKAKFAILDIKRDFASECIPLIGIRSPFVKRYYAIQVSYDKGQAVVMSSVAYAEDRAELLAHLLTNSSIHLKEYQEEINTQLKDLLPKVINESFEIYNEIPLEVLQRKLASVTTELDPIDLILLLEELIRSGEVSATISNNFIAKK